MLRNILLIALCLSLTACLLTVDSNNRNTRTAWDDTDVSRLQPGQTSAEWVRTTFGEPVSRRSYDDGSEIWKYRNRSEKDTQVGLFLLFSVDVESERVETLSVEFEDGVVTGYWIDTEKM